MDIANSLLFGIFGIFVVCWMGTAGVWLCAHRLEKIADKLDALRKKDDPTP